MNDSHLSLEGFNFYRADREGMDCGGVGIYVRNDFAVETLAASKPISEIKPEYLILQITTLHTKYYLLPFIAVHSPTIHSNFYHASPRIFVTTPLPSSPAMSTSTWLIPLPQTPPSLKPSSIATPSTSVHLRPLFINSGISPTSGLPSSSQEISIPCRTIPNPPLHS